MLVNSWNAATRLVEIADTLERGELLPIDEVVAAVKLWGELLTDSTLQQGKGLLAALALLCSRRPSLFYPLAPVVLRPFLKLGCIDSYSIVQFAHRLIDEPQPMLPLDKPARQWISREFVLLGPVLQDVLGDMRLKQAFGQDE